VVLINKFILFTKLYNILILFKINDYTKIK
jgi:hypothetical protein